MIDDWYPRLQTSGLLDTLAPYAPVLVGAHPLAIASDGAPIEIACRAVDLAAFARVIERAYGEQPGFALHPGSLDEEEAVFAEFTLEGLPIEVAGQREHVHRRLGAATLGVAQMLELEGEPSRTRLAARVAAGQDWLDAAMEQSGLTRSALESLATANSAVARRVLGVRAPSPALRAYAIPLLVGLVAEVLIVAATAARGSGDFTGAMLLVEAAVLGALFGVRMGLAASLTPLLLFGTLSSASMLVGNESCGNDGCGIQYAGYLFIAILVASTAGFFALLRDRYLPR